MWALVWVPKVLSMQPISDGEDSEFRHFPLLQHKKSGDLLEEMGAHGVSNPHGASDDEDEDFELRHFTVVHTQKWIEHCSTLPEDGTHYDRYRTQGIHGFVEYIGHPGRGGEWVPEMHKGWKKSTDLILTGHHQVFQNEEEKEDPSVFQNEEEKEDPSFFENRRSLLGQMSEQGGGAGQRMNAVDKDHQEPDNTTISGMLQQVKRALDQADQEAIDAGEEMKKALHHVESHRAQCHTQKKRLSAWETTKRAFGDLEQLTRYHQNHDRLSHSLKMTQESLVREQDTLKKKEKECERAGKALYFWKKIQNNMMGNLDQGALHSADEIKRCLLLMDAAVQNQPRMETVWNDILTKHRQAQDPWNQVCNALKEIQDHGDIPQRALGSKEDLDWDTWDKKQELLDLGEKVSHSLVQCQKTYRDFYCQLVNALIVFQDKTQSRMGPEEAVVDKAIATIRQLNTAVAWFLNDISKKNPSPVVF